MASRRPIAPEVPVSDQSRPSPEESGTGWTWARLLRWSIVAIVAGGILTMVLLIGGFDPVVTAIAILFLVGLALMRRGGRAGVILILVVDILFLAFAGPFFFLGLALPESTAEFMINSLFLAAGATTLVAAIALLRRRTGPSETSRRVGHVAGIVGVVAILYAGFVRVTLDEATARPGDLTMVAENIEFSEDRLSASTDPVAVTIDNEDLTVHTFSIDELDVHEILPGGVTTRVTFDAEPGEYHFYCEVQGHEDVMRGTLTVE
jgi:hypothetical protein